MSKIIDSLRKGMNTLEIKVRDLEKRNSELQLQLQEKDKLIFELKNKVNELERNKKHAGMEYLDYCGGIIGKLTDMLAESRDFNIESDE